MPGVDELRQDFAEHVWPIDATIRASAAMGAQRGAVSQLLVPVCCHPHSPVGSDGQEQPLHKLLGSKSDRVRAYGSGLDFPLTDAQAVRRTELLCRQGQSRPSQTRTCKHLPPTQARA